MPELPEVETTRRGLAPHLPGRTVVSVVVRQPKLRWPIPADLADVLHGGTIEGVARRAKYLLLRIHEPASGRERGTLVLHLGMSGSLHVVDADTPPQRHDHLDVVLDDGRCLRLRDPRRFGSVQWQPAGEVLELFYALGPEPLDDAFDGDHLHHQARGRRQAVKAFLMDNRIVVGVGNIYATEALFRAGIHPARAAGRIGRARYHRLAAAVVAVLEEAIAVGGTTLRDFTAADGQPGYFRIRLAVYGRAGEPCPACGRPLLSRRIGQRNSVYCGHCQR